SVQTGGLARVARVRQLLKSENSHTYTLLAGDLVSPSALGQAIVNGTALKGLQMIATMNTLGLDYMTFGNHEFDLKEPDLLQRMSESKFTWISTNVFNKTSGNNLSYASSIPYKLLTISNVRILIFGLTIDMNTGGYVTIINSTSLVPFVREFLRTLENKSVEYDVLIGLTHLDLKTDIDLVENIPGIDVIFGGHEHEDYYLVRGLTYTPIYKADDNAISVYIHRCAFNVNKKLFRIYSTLARITSDIDDEPETAKVANYWFNMESVQTGGLARVARVRQLLKSENSHTYTLLAGDLVSPSALGQAIVNGTALKGLQMIATMNTLGLDYMTFGNHEFDLKEPDLLQRMSESKFTWISTNVFNKTSGNNLSYASSIPYKLLTISNVRILIFGLTIDMNTGGYVTIINSTSLVPFVREFLRTLENKSVEYDVLIGLTHLDLKTDIDLVENIPGIDVIFGGHEHEDYYLVRGLTYTPIYKADDNAISVYIHRCAFNVNKKLFRIYSTLARITSDIDDEPETAKVANYWFNMGMQGFIDKGFEPNKTVAILPPDVQLDGRSTSVRNFPTLLSNYSCECMVKETESNGTIIGLSNSGSIRVDDVLTGIITQYDVLRTLPFDNYVMSLSVPGALLSKVLTTGLSAIGSGMFVSYTGVHTNDNGATWLLNQDGTNIATSGENYNVATTDFEKYNTGL
ncbi:unnamed protein product, partial [Didymodactylos carnosus]